MARTATILWLDGSCIGCRFPFLKELPFQGAERCLRLLLLQCLKRALAGYY